MNNIYLLFYLWTHAEENPGWILQYDIQLCHQIKPRQQRTIVSLRSQFLLNCRLLLPVHNYHSYISLPSLTQESNFISRGKSQK